MWAYACIFLAGFPIAGGIVCVCACVLQPPSDSFSRPLVRFLLQPQELYFVGALGVSLGISGKEGQMGCGSSILLMIPQAAGKLKSAVAYVLESCSSLAHIHWDAIQSIPAPKDLLAPQFWEVLILRQYRPKGHKVNQPSPKLGLRHSQL